MFEARARNLGVVLNFFIAPILCPLKADEKPKQSSTELSNNV